MNTKVLFNRVLVILLSTFLLLTTINIKSFADIEKNNKGTIEVKGVEPGVKVSVYRLTKVNYDFGEKGSNQPFEPPYEWNESVKTWLEGNYSQYVEPEDFQEKVMNNSQEAASFYDALAAAVRSNHIVLDTADTKEATGGVPGVAEQNVTIDDLEMGTYLVLIENGYKVYRPSVVNLVPTFDDSSKTWKMTTPAIVDIKSNELTITKKVTDEDVSTIDTIKYTVTADVPNFPDKSLAKNYYISDIFGNGLTDVNNIKVYGLEEGGDSTELSDKEDYTLETENAKRPCKGKENEDTTFTIKFNYENIRKYKKVKVEYEAKLKQGDSTVLAEGGNLNKAYLDYSNNPYDAASWNTQSAEELVYTYELQVSKIDKDKRDLFLTGAHFTLSKESDESSPIKFVRLSDGTYYQSTDASATEDLVVSETEDETKGKLYIRGLDTGTYYLTETKAPDGYNKLRESIDVTIEHGNNKKLEVENNKGFILPLTGGIGTTIFTIIGSVLFGIGLLLGIVIIIKKSKLSKDIK